MKKQLLIKTMTFGLLTFFFTQSGLSQEVKTDKKERPTPEKIMEKFDANKDAKISEDEVQGRLKKHFAKIDANEDGAISMDELKAMPKRDRKGKGHGKRKGNRPSPDKIMEKLDGDKDAKLSSDEVKGPLKKNFAEIDLDQDGYLSLEELKKVPKRNYKGKGKRKSER